MKKILFALIAPVIAVAQDTGQNYIKTTAYKVPTSIAILLPQASQASQSVTYFDGLGRPVQQVASKQSSEGNDIVTHIEYDDFGRQVRDYMPYPSQGSSMSFTNSMTARQATLTHYQTESGDTNPFSEKRFEKSPLNRVLQQAAPGNPWAMAPQGQADHSVKITYETNAGTDAVRLYKAVAGPIYNGYYPAPLSQQGTYAPNQIYKTVTKDENWTSGKAHTTEEFKDKEGRVLLKRTYGESVAGSGMQFAAHDTYYVYDQYGNLTYVLPPLSDGSGSLQDLEGLCYQYRYDYRNRLVEKKLPGKAWEFIIYDRMDRVVATGPAYTPITQRGKVTPGWLVSKYDVLNRPILKGWLGSGTLNMTSLIRQNLQNSLNLPTSNTSESRSNTGSTVNGIFFQYTNNNWPTAMDVITVNYYDDYEFPEAPQTIPVSVAGVSQPVHYNKILKPKGLLTGSWTRALERYDEYRGTSIYVLYDSKARPVRNNSTNYLGGYTQADSKIDFSGKTLYTITEHKRAASDVAITIREDFSYTDQDRLLTHTHQVNGGDVHLLALNEYDKLGQMVRKSVGGTDISGGAALQKVDYSYNIRGWLKGINAGIPNPADLFVFEMKYDAPDSAQPLFNGNISETYWKTASDMLGRRYNYVYDDLNRLRGASYLKASQNYVATHAYNEAMQYDRNGNITHLWRNGNNDGPIPFEIDNLAYAYDQQNPNRLARVTDGSLDPAGFRDGANIGDDYAYDSYGNMTSDANKGITRINYNHLNLPTNINFGSQLDKIDYLYDGNGKKLKKTVRKANINMQQGYIESTMDYLDGFQYDNGELMFFPTAEGYVSHVSGQFNYVYNYTDHLGNVRLSYGLDPQTNAIKIIEENHYYPFGMKHTNYNGNTLGYQERESAVVLKAAPVTLEIAFKYNYKYQGQERQDELGLNWDSFKWRNYDYAIGRFMSIDPLAEKYPYNSTYAFQENKMGMGVELEGLELAPKNPVSGFGNYVKGKFDSAVSSIRTNTEKAYQAVSSAISSLEINQVDGYNFSGSKRGVAGGTGFFNEAKGAIASGTLDAETLSTLSDLYGPDFSGVPEGTQFLVDIYQTFFDGSNSSYSSSETSVEQSSSSSGDQKVEINSKKFVATDPIRGNSSQVHAFTKKTSVNKTSLDSVKLAHTKDSLKAVDDQDKKNEEYNKTRGY